MTPHPLDRRVALAGIVLVASLILSPFIGSAEPTWDTVDLGLRNDYGAPINMTVVTDEGAWSGPARFTGMVVVDRALVYAPAASAELFARLASLEAEVDALRASMEARP